MPDNDDVLIGPATAPESPAPAPSPSPALQPSPAVGALLVMVDAATDFGVVELERLLASLLRGPAPTAAEERVAELSALAQLLTTELAVSYPRHPIAPMQVSRTDYDASRPAGAPTAETLVRRYGTVEKDGWSWACRAAWGLLPDGRKTKPGVGWASGLRGKKRAPRSDRDLVIRSIRRCAFALLRRPSSNMYIEWLAAQRRRAKDARGAGGQASEPVRNASIPAVYQQFPRGWATALAAADITDAELTQARGELLAARSSAAGVPDAEQPADRFAALNAEHLAQLGIDDRTRKRLLRKGFGELPLSHAAAVARELGGSLEWLAGMDASPGEPADVNMRFAPDALRAASKRSGVTLEALRAKARLDISGWRAVMSRKREPTLQTVLVWSRSTRTPLAALVTSATSSR